MSKLIGPDFHSTVNARHNLTLGLIMCTDKSDGVVEYTLGLDRVAPVSRGCFDELRLKLGNHSWLTTWPSTNH